MAVAAIDDYRVHESVKERKKEEWWRGGEREKDKKCKGALKIPNP